MSSGISGKKKTPYFQICMIAIIVSMVCSHKILTKFTNKFTTNKWILFLTYMFPLMIVIYFDMRDQLFSFEKMGIPVYMGHRINTILRLLGAYGIIQVFAQDIGVKTGDNQAVILRYPFIQFIIYFATAYSISDDRSESLIAATAYFIIKYNVSNNVTQ